MDINLETLLRRLDNPAEFAFIEGWAVARKLRAEHQEPVLVMGEEVEVPVVAFIPTPPVVDKSEDEEDEEKEDGEAVLCEHADKRTEREGGYEITICNECGAELDVHEIEED